MKEIRLCDDTKPEKVLRLCEANGFGIEVQGFYNTNMIDDVEKTNELLKQTKSVLINFKGGKSLHAPFWDMNLGSKNKMVKEITMKAFNYAYNVAKKLGCTEIVVHNGFTPNTSYYEGWSNNAAAFWQEFFADKDDSITMMVENQCEESSEVLRMEIDKVSDPRLKVCLDIGHVHANSNMSLEDWIKTLGNRIGYVHMHNNHGRQMDRPPFKNDEHLGLNDGTIDMVKTFELLEEYCPDAIWTLECGLKYMEESIEMLKTIQ